MELIICIALIALLIAILTPSLKGILNRGKQTAYNAQIKQIHEAAVMCSLDYPNQHIIWESFAGQRADKFLLITNDNLRDTWNLYFDEYPSDPTGKTGSTFRVEIFEDGDIQITQNYNL